MESTGVEWTQLSDTFGYYTVTVEGIDEYTPETFPSAPINNCFKAWKAPDELEKFIGDIVEELMPSQPNIGRKC